MNTVKVGDEVYWQSSRSRPPSLVTITGIDLCTGPNVKYGVSVDAVPVDLLSRCCIDMDNGHWSYGTDITVKKKQ